MKPIQYGQPQYQALPGIMDPVSIRNFNGLNTLDPLSITDNYFTEMSNLTTDEFPLVTTRPGYTVLGTHGTKVLGMGAWKGQELHAVFNDGTWRKWNGSTWTTLLTGLSMTAEWYFTNFEGNLSGVHLIACNGVNPIKKYDGSTVVDLSGAPANGKYITTYQNRLWCAVGNELWSCALDKPETWDKFTGNADDSYRRQMESTRGEQINMLTGSLTKLTIGMPNSLHELYGGLPADFTIKLITDDMGLSNNKSAVTQEGFMRFMHRTGIYDYGGGTLPDKSFSDIVRGALNGITDQSVAGSDGTKMYFNLPPDRLLVYDPRVKAWSMWRGIQATHFLEINNELYIGDNSGRVLKLGGTTDGGTAIQWHAVTKPFNNGIIARKQRWYKLWMVVEFTGTLNVHLSKEKTGDTWELVQDLTSTGGASSRRVFIPVGKYALENWIRVKFSGTGTVKLHEFARQARQLPLY